MPVLIPTLTGSLGDQLFQVSMALTLSKLVGSSLYLSHKRATPDNWIDTVFSAFPTYPGDPPVSLKTISEPENLKTMNFVEYYCKPSHGSDTLLEGKFMNWIYVPKDIRRFLSFPNTAGLLSKYKDILSDRCFIHLDFSNEVDLSDYYRRSIEFMKSIGYTKFAVFSKNKEIIDDIDSIHIAESSDETLVYLMTLCNAGIMANSSLSWWGAFLNRSRDICVPSKWFKDPKYNIGGVYFNNCTIIHV